MTHRLATNYAKNYCNRTPIVKVIVENVVTCFLGHTVVIMLQCWAVCCELSEKYHSPVETRHIIVYVSNSSLFNINYEIHLGGEHSETVQIKLQSDIMIQVRFDW